MPDARLQRARCAHLAVRTDYKPAAGLCMDCGQFVARVDGKWQAVLGPADRAALQDEA